MARHTGVLENSPSTGSVSLTWHGRPAREWTRPRWPCHVERSHYQRSLAMGIIHKTTTAADRWTRGRGTGPCDSRRSDEQNICKTRNEPTMSFRISKALTNSRKCGLRAPRSEIIVVQASSLLARPKCTLEGCTTTKTGHPAATNKKCAKQGTNPLCALESAGHCRTNSRACGSRVPRLTWYRRPTVQGHGQDHRATSNESVPKFIWGHYQTGALRTANPRPGKGDFADR